ncbi:MAG TPA: Gldg family protein [Anaerolineaceae bacterium]
MKIQWSKYAHFALYLSLIAVLFSAGYYIVTRKFDLVLQISLALIIIGLAVFALLDPQKVRQAVTGRQARYGSNVFVMFVAILGILVVINYLVYKNSKRWDLTEDKQHTLSKETLDILGSLTSPVIAEAYFTPNSSTATAKDLLETYKYHSNGKFSYEFIDPIQDPVRATAAKVNRDGTIVVKMKDRSEQIAYASEQELTTALIRLEHPEKKTIYFLTGHGEYSIESGDQKGYNQARITLEGKNYKVSTLNLISERKIPEDATVIIVAGPQKPITQEEADLLAVFTNNGKGLIYLTEPLPVTQFGTQQDPLADYLSKVWKISLGNDLILDPAVNPPTVAISDTYGNHAITNPMTTMATVFFTARSVSVTETSSGDFSSTVLVKTGSSAWGETDFQALQNNRYQPDQGKDLLGPVPLAVASTNNASNGRIVVIGDADFGSNQLYAQSGNSDFFVNSVDWVARQDTMINLTPKNMTTRILMAPSIVNMGIILLVTVFLIPGIVFIVGISVWISRRRKG